MKELGKPEALNLSCYDVVFVDSQEVLGSAWELGLSHSIKVKTCSPTLLSAVSANTEYVEDRWDEASLELLYCSTSEVIGKLHERAKGSAELADYAVLVARGAVRFLRVLTKAACLSENDLTEPRLILSVATDNAGDAEGINSPWMELLANNPLAHELKLPAKDRRICGSSSTRAGSIERWRLGGFETVLYRLAILVWRYLPKRWGRMNILVCSENELVIESCACLALRGATLEHVNASVGDVATLSNEEREALEALIYPEVRRFFSYWVIPELVERCSGMFSSELEAALVAQKGAMRWWANSLSRDRTAVKKLLVTNHTGSPAIVGMVKAFQDEGVLTVAMQHGVTPEIGGLTKLGVPYFENNVVDYFLTFNEEAERCYNSSPYKRGCAISIGAPRRYFRTGTLSRRYGKEAPSMLYVSTKLYHGNRTNLTGFLNDRSKARQESDLVEQVLGKLPHRLMFKPYPEENRRYADEDPIIRLAKEKANIEVYEKCIDLRYLLHAHRVVIASRATSTISWCLLSGNPLVFINYAAEYPLNPSAKEAFLRSVFVFDANEDGFFQNLRDFLSQPVRDIEQQWRERKSNRIEMISRFISGRGPGAGQRAADLIWAQCASPN